MDWLANNWVWVGLVGLMLGMHLFGHGHGGHGGGRGHGGKGGGGGCCGGQHGDKAAADGDRSAR